MNMFCYQCQEAAQGIGCTTAGVCGKKSDVANMQDLLIYITKGVSILATESRNMGIAPGKADNYTFEALFMTITNANFDRGVIENKIRQGIEVRNELISQLTAKGWTVPADLHDSATWVGNTEEEMIQKSLTIGIMNPENEDIRSLKELLTYGIKGMAAYAEHAYNLGYLNDEVFAFIEKGLTATTSKTITGDELLALCLECGKYGVDAMALLDKANTESYGHPEITEVNLGVGTNPGILISGHDLRDMEDLLKQTEGTGIDVYTHSEMLPAHYYPAFKKYKHFVGNYGNAWWEQKKEFEAFNGPVLLTTNCLVPPLSSYKDRVYTTGAAGFTGCKHIKDREKGGQKDFSAIIEHAKKCAAPKELETGTIVGGFAHNQVLQLADKVIAAVKSGDISKFVVMAGCDGRSKEREYYTEFAKALPEDTVILTAGCAKYRYNKLQLGDIGGIPRVLDAGQCNDSYSLAVIALKLKEAFGLDDINDLPIVYNIAWYEQKAVIVLLALLHLGVKNIHLGPTLPAFLSTGVVTKLVETFKVGITNAPEVDVKVFMTY